MFLLVAAISLVFYGNEAVIPRCFSCFSVSVITSQCCVTFEFVGQSQRNLKGIAKTSLEKIKLCSIAMSQPIVPAASGYVCVYLSILLYYTIVSSVLKGTSTIPSVCWV